MSKITGQKGCWDDEEEKPRPAPRLNPVHELNVTNTRIRNLENQIEALKSRVSALEMETKATLRGVERRD